MPKTHVIAIDDHPRGKARMEFDIDFETGKISGLLVEGLNPEYADRELRGLATQDRAYFPWQQAYPTPEPFRRPESLAWLLLSRGWVLQGDLARIQPPKPGRLPPGAIS